MADFVKVAGTAELTPGTGVVAEVNGQAIAHPMAGGSVSGRSTRPTF